MAETLTTSVLIIGAGPAGLAVAGRLSRMGIPYEILEKSGEVGHAWHHHYDRLHLHTVKELSHLPHRPFPEEYPRYVSREQLVAYFEAYAQEFRIRPHFHEEVVRVEKKDGKWVTRTASGKEFLSEAVVVATGVNRKPYRPVFKGAEQFKGQLIHSREYKNAGPFLGKKVLVVGMGNTGAEIALELAENGIATFLSVRSPTNIVPRDFMGRPTQQTALALAKLPHWLGDRIGILLRMITVGDLSRYGIVTPKMPPAKQLRVTGKTPVVDIGTVEMIKAGKISVCPDIDHFVEDGIVFRDGRRFSFDAVILATGYRAGVEDFLKDTEGLLDEYEVPNCCIATGRNKGLYFIGFDNYTAGGILGVIMRDSARIAEELNGVAV